MFKHHFLLTVRNLKRHKGSFFINLIGLSTGLACAFLIYLWVDSERSWDGFHVNGPRLYQIMEKSEENKAVKVHESTQGPLAAALVTDLPEVAKAVSVFSAAQQHIFVSMRVGDKVIKRTGIFAGKDLFSVFSFPLLYGKPQDVLTDPRSIVITEEVARSLFGSANAAVGKTIEWDVIGIKKEAKVSGVCAQPPYNNSLVFDFACPFEMFVNEIWTNGKQWYNEGPQTYVLLKEGTNAAAFDAKIKDFIQKYQSGSIFHLFVRPFSSGYLYGKYVNGVQTGGRIAYVRLLSIVGLFILVIACINFMNLSTAKASRRLKEVGIKKVVGSSRGMLVLQFLTEAVVMAFLSLALATVMVALLLPVFRQVTGVPLTVTFTPMLVGIILGTTLLTGLVAGSYPALYLSGFRPVSILKGRMPSSLGELLARKGLVVFQFSISLVLIVAVAVIYRQLEYVQTENLGYNRDNVIYFDKTGTIVPNQEAFLTGLKKIPGVVDASAIESSVVEMAGGSSTYDVHWPGKDEKVKTNFMIRSVDFHMIELLGIPVKEGRSFSPAFGAEDDKLIFNETAIRLMGLKHPIGMKVSMWGKDKMIIGVVKDFHMASLHEPIQPMLFKYDPGSTRMIMAKIRAGQERSTLTDVEAYFKEFNPGNVFEYKFLDAQYQAQYVAEQRVSVLSRYFAGLAILISCLGLFGLAAYNAEVRTKEIGIRKVLGASIPQVMVLLSKDFVRLIGLSMLIAFPLAAWVMQNWLNGFAYHVHLGVWVFVIAGLALFICALGTVSYQAARAALVNPARSLKAE